LKEEETLKGSNKFLESPQRERTENPPPGEENFPKENPENPKKEKTQKGEELDPLSLPIRTFCRS